MCRDKSTFVRRMALVACLVSGQLVVSYVRSFRNSYVEVVRNVVTIASGRLLESTSSRFLASRHIFIASRPPHLTHRTARHVAAVLRNFEATLPVR
jgi:general stress protein CsbA